ncbi:GntR family transcriptional regulator [Eubacteriales bacterium OttesenSCG-928-K08]|nr:GntR family transcriptional regulator [Eubacteriales bacterium OttesenSCG-928-K08]
MEDLKYSRLEAPPREPGQNNRQYAHHVLYSNIMSLNLEPGCLLSDAELSLMLGISRTPVREAIVQLVEARLVEVYPQRSSFVSHINLDYVEEGIFARYSIEPNVLREATSSASSADISRLKECLLLQRAALEDERFDDYVHHDNQFHRLIYHMAGKPWTWEMITSLSTHLNRVRLLQFRAGSQTLHEGFGEHNRLFEMIVSRNLEGIDDFLQGHISSGYRAVLPVLLEKYPSYFALN